MIRWAVDAFVAAVVTPQTLGTVPADRRVTLDLQTSPLDVALAEVDVAGVQTIPLAREVGGSGRVRHTLAVELTVQDGDLAAGLTRRDAIVLDLVLRLWDRPDLLGAVSPDGRQSVGSTSVVVEYGATGGDGLASGLTALARLTVTVDANVERA